MTNAQIIGRASRSKGLKAERDLAKYLRAWWPNAERSVVTGFRAGDHIGLDHGDIRGTPITWQCKYLADMTDKQLQEALTETENQTDAAGHPHGVLVQRRHGKAYPGCWWAWMRLDALIRLANDGCPPRLLLHRDPPVRMLLDDMVDLLVLAGFAEVTP